MSEVSQREETGLETGPLTFFQHRLSRTAENREPWAAKLLLQQMEV